MAPETAVAEGGTQASQRSWGNRDVSVVVIIRTGMGSNSKKAVGIYKSSLLWNKGFHIREGKGFAYMRGHQGAVVSVVRFL